MQDASKISPACRHRSRTNRSMNQTVQYIWDQSWGERVPPGHDIVTNPRCPQLGFSRPSSQISVRHFESSEVWPRPYMTWPDAPKDTIMSIGAGGNCSALIPSKNLILVCARGKWGKLKAGAPQSKMNQHLKTLAGAVDHP